MDTPEKNPAAVALGRLGGASRSAAKRAASARNGAAGGRPPRPAGPSHVWTEREVLDILGDGSYTAPAGAGLHVRAECLPGEDDSAPAQFTVSPSWADTIGPRDDCDASVEALVRRISARFPSPDGWSYDRANGTIDQVATFGAPGWAPVATPGA